MSERKDGGQAFPYAAEWGYQDGMTLRDWFAGLFMQGCAADPTSHDLFDDMQDMARASYEAADAMIAARAEGGAE